MSQETGPEDEQVQAALTMFEQVDIAFGVFRDDGLLIASNTASDRLYGVSREATLRRFNPLKDQGSLDMGFADIWKRIFQGETVKRDAYRYDSTHLGTEDAKGHVVWCETTYFPLKNGEGKVTYLGTMTRNVSREIEQRQELEAARERVNAAQLELAAHRETITALGSPVIQVWEGILTVPLVGAIDERRATRVTQDLLEAVVKHRAEIVILDITGVDTVDAQIASYLISTIQSCKLLGCQAALVGIGADIARTMVHIGVDLSGIVTRANLEAGIAWAFERRGLRVV
jgi:anti-anti-sigma regulatory factor